MIDHVYLGVIAGLTLFSLGALIFIIGRILIVITNGNRGEGLVRLGRGFWWLALGVIIGTFLADFLFTINEFFIWLHVHSNDTFITLTLKSLA